MNRILLGILACLLPACAAAHGQRVGDGGTDGSANTPVCGNSLIELGEQCDDGNSEGGDGCSATCQFESCSVALCPLGCCDLQGQCVSGTEDNACGAGGVACVSCSTSGEVCQDQACEALPSCNPGDTLPCGNCGTRLCSAEGTWGTCAGEGLCSAGAEEQGGSCGACGTLTRVCTETCTWTTWSCTGEGVCTVGTLENGGTCGLGGHEQRICQSDCTWGVWTCEGEGTCTPGAIETGASCGNCGTLQRTCDSQGVWGAWICTAEGVCAAGSTETGGSCGNCGTERRTCSTSCTWGAWSCIGEGVCSPGATQTGSSCCPSPCSSACISGSGTYKQTCTTSCTWGASVCTVNTSCTVTGHYTCGENGDSCSSSIDEKWRCVYSAHWGVPISQVCRDATAGVWTWVTVNLSPGNCSACCGSWQTAFSTYCYQP